MLREWKSLYNSRSVIVTLSSLCRYFSPDQSVVPLTRFARESVYSSSLTSSQVISSCSVRFERLTLSQKFELPSILLMRKVGCRVWLSAIVLACTSTLVVLSLCLRHSLALSDCSPHAGGAVMTGMAFCTNWVGLAVCRVLLGLFESGFFPSCVFLITTWYKRGEVAKRLSIFVNSRFNFPLKLH